MTAAALATETLVIWPGGNPVAVEGIPPEPFAGLTVTRDPEAPETWCVIHRRTGCPVAAGYGTAGEAVEVMARLESLCDWTVSGEDLLEAWPGLQWRWEQLTGEAAA